MKTLTDTELRGLNGGLPCFLTQFGEQLAADGLAYMDSGNPIKAGLGMIIAAGGGWAFAFGNSFDALCSLWPSW